MISRSIPQQATLLGAYCQRRAQSDDVADGHLCTPHRFKAGLFLWVKQGTREPLTDGALCMLVVVGAVFVRVSVCAFLSVFAHLQQWLCAAVFPAVSSRCFTYLFLHLHPLPTHLPLKGLPVVLFSFYSTLLLSLNSLFSPSVKHSGRNVVFSLFHLFLDQFKESVACVVIYGGWILILTKQETAAKPSQIIYAAIEVKAGGWYCDCSGWPVAFSGRKKAASPFTFVHSEDVKLISHLYIFLLCMEGKLTNPLRYQFVQYPRSLISNLGSG